MAKKAATRLEKEHMNRVASLGCIACINMGYEDTPSEIHHIKSGMGAGQRAPHTMVLPLCFHHHSAQGVDGFHKHPSTWQEKHGTELQLLEQVGELLC